MKNTIDAPTQASQEKRLSEDGYEYVGNKGDTIIVGLDHDVALSCDWRPHTIEINVDGTLVYHYS